jgi:hypothetical protein
MNKYIITVIVVVMLGIAAYFIVPIFLFSIIFGSTRIEKTNISYDDVINELKPFDRYDLKLKYLSGGKNYSLLFDKGMDHICVVRIDGAETTIKNIESSKIKKEVGVGSGIGPGPSWYYDMENDDKYISYHLDGYNYYVIDEKDFIVWYVQFST